MILGKNVSCSTNSEETGLNNNVVVVGGSGSGKTMSVIEPRLLETFDSNLIVTVTKRRLIDQYKALFAERGYRVEELNLVNPEKSTVSFDPLHYIKTNADIACLAEAIVVSENEHISRVDPYWSEAAQSMLCALIAFIHSTRDSASFADVLALHSDITIHDKNQAEFSTSIDRQFFELSQFEPDSFAVSCWKTFHEVPTRTARCIYGTLNVALDKMFPFELQVMMAMKHKLDFEKFSNQKTVLFVYTSAVNPALHRFVNIFYSQAFKSLFEFAEDQPEHTLPIPTQFLADDFATGGPVANFAEYISIFREKGISATILLQSESQLEKIYGKQDSVSIINNCDTFVFLGGMDFETCRDVSLRLNAPLEDVLYMPIGREIVFRRGQKPIVTTRYPTREHKTYQKLAAFREPTVSEEQTCPA